MDKATKCKSLMYKRPALQSLGYDAILDELYEIQDACNEIRYVTDADKDTIIDALDGDEDEAYEFLMMFSDLSASCEQLYSAITDNTYSDVEFNDLTVALIGNRYSLIGYDSYEEDWYSLTGYQTELAVTEAGKRIMRHTKAEMLSMIGQALGVTIAFMELRQQYDYLKATMDIIRERNCSHLKIIKEIDKAYDDAAECYFSSWEKATQRFDNLIEALPERTWLE